MAQMLAKPGTSGRQPITPEILRDIVAGKTDSKGIKYDPDMFKHQQLNSLMCNTLIEHNTNLDIDSKPAPFKLTAIVCTIGPATRGVPVLKKMMEAGMNICRLNFSHGTQDQHKETLRNIREAVSQMPDGFVVGIAADIRGPEIRTGNIEGGPSAEIILKTGDKITVTVNKDYAQKCSTSMLYIDYPKVVIDVQPDKLIQVDDGHISLKVLEKKGEGLVCQILKGGALGSRKRINLPGVKINLPVVSDEDKRDLSFAVEQGVDMIFAHHLKEEKDVQEIRHVVGDKGKHIKILAKIESYEGIQNFNDILEKSDGAIVARGDMGIEIGPEKVFVAQKRIISTCNKAGKPVVCATQMLESMTHKITATRSESNDVANAVLDGADCVMLCGETAIGEYPVEAVIHMKSLCMEAESVFFSLRVFTELKEFNPLQSDMPRTIAQAAVDISYQCMASAIIALSTTGRTVHLLSQFKPRCPIIMITRNETTARQAHLYRGIIPYLFKADALEQWEEDCTIRIKAGMQLGISQGLIKKNDPVLLVMGLMSGPGKTNSIQIITCKEGPPR